MTTQDLADRARALANELFRNEHAACSQQTDEYASCLEKEEAHPFNRAEKALGWVHRPFEAYNPDRLCPSCRAYWHAELAAQTLHRLTCLEAKAAATT